MFSTKKYFVWEFVLNGKYHKVEMFHSKMSGKKKLCVDAQAISENKSYKNDFTYSFKIDKNYFNVIQLNSDKYEMRVDNRSFDILIQEERSGKLKSDNKEDVAKVTSKKVVEEEVSNNHPKFSPMPSNLRTNPRGSVSNVNNPRNSNAGNFFNDDDFEFNNGNNGHDNNRNARRSVIPAESRNTPGNNQTNNFANFNEFTNKFSSSGVNTNKSNSGSLLEVNDIGNRRDVAKDNKNLLNQINFDEVLGSSRGENNKSEVYKHNQNVLNNFNILPLGEENIEVFNNIPNRGSVTNTNSNYNVQQEINSGNNNMNFFDTGMSNISQNRNINVSNSPYHDMSGGNISTGFNVNQSNTMTFNTNGVNTDNYNNNFNNAYSNNSLLSNYQDQSKSSGTNNIPNNTNSSNENMNDLKVN